MELLGVVIVGAVIVALGIALAPFILPLVLAIGLIILGSWLAASVLRAVWPIRRGAVHTSPMDEKLNRQLDDVWPVGAEQLDRSRRRDELRRLHELCIAKTRATQLSLGRREGASSPEFDGLEARYEESREAFRRDFGEDYLDGFGPLTR